MSLKGIDTSYWKKDIDLSKIAYDFVYTKATEGNYFVDPSCDPIVEQAKAGGKKWGVFHFATNRFTDAITEADYFVDNCEGYVGKGILVLDYENYTTEGKFANDAHDVAWALAWLNHVFKRTGVRPLIYMSLSITKEANWQPIIDADYGLIVAAYVKNNDPVYNYAMSEALDPNPSWGPVGNVMWQFTSTGRINGYGGNLDCNFFYGNTGTWDAYAAAVTPDPTPVEAPEPVPTPEPTPVPPADPGTIITPTPVEPTPDPVPEITPPVVVPTRPPVEYENEGETKSMSLTEFISYARKFMVALVAALGVLATSLADGSVSNSEWVSILIAFMGALGVYSISNKETK